ncbi:hypothetical protein K440DRAFT_560946 [Wilcoxina mikolae CBS 423.85]|nr:hypothetical protein K440DRAFT_560946 [Wilcoxina mikolae CBS 423.85]
MTDVKKGMIIAFFYCLGTISAVARVMGKPWSTIRNFLVRTTERQSIDNLQSSGRPVKLSQRDRQAILRAARHNRQLTNAEIRRFHAPHVSISTIQRFLWEL